MATSSSISIAAALAPPSDGHERPFRLFAEFLPNLAWIAGADGSIHWYNRAWYDYTGTTPQQMEGWGWQTVHLPSALPGVLERWQRSIATGEPFEMVFPLRAADGSFRPFLTRVAPFIDADGAILHWFGTNTDISREHQSAAALRDSEARFRTATQAVDAILWTNDRNGEMRGPQPSWQAFTGQTYDQYQGFGWASAVHPDDAQPTIDAWNESVRSRSLFAFEHRVRRHDGVFRLCSIRALPVLDGAGVIREWVGVHTDITHQKRAEAVLLQSEKLAAVGRLASSIAHEINNPLESVSNLIYLAQQSASSPEQRTFLDLADQELRRVSAIANQTLRFHKQATRPQSIDCADLFATVLSIYEGKLRNAGVTVEKRKLATHPVVCLEGEIRQVLSNLVGNAIDAMPGGGKLHIRSRETTDWNTSRRGLALTVADTGSGMDSATVQRVFEAFFTTKGFGGTGLGLWVSAEIMERHHGRIRIRSSQRAAHHGTVITLFLPFPDPSVQ